VNKDNEITGIFTARDLLRCIEEQNLDPEMVRKQRREGDSKSSLSSSSIHDVLLRDIMTAKEKLIYCSPSDSSRHCREIMFQCRIRNLPVIEDGEVRGIITAKLLADSSFNILDTGGRIGMMVDR